MFKLLVLTCLLASCLAGPFDLPSWVRDVWQRRPVRGCADRAAGRLACARANNSDTLAPHPHDCHLFFYCSSTGARPACRRCPARLQFNPELQVCDWPRNVNCTARPPRPRPSGRPSHNGTTPYPTIPAANATDPTNEPTSGHVTTDAPTSVHVTTDESTSVHVTTDPPTSVHVTTDEPTSVHVTTDDPTSVHVTTDAPTSVHVTTDESTSVHVTTDAPTSVHVTTDDPTSVHVTTDDSTSGPTTTNN